MRKLILLAILVVDAGCGHPPASARAQAGINAGTPDVVGQRVRATFAAIARADTAALGGLLSDSLRWLSPTSGAVYDRPQLLAAAAEGSAPLIVFERDANGRVTGYVQQQPDGIVARARRLP